MASVAAGHEVEHRDLHAVERHLIGLPLHGDLEQVPVADRIYWKRAGIVRALEAVDRRGFGDRQPLRCGQLVYLDLEPEIDADKGAVVVITRLGVGKTNEHAGIGIFLPAPPFELEHEIRRGWLIVPEEADISARCRQKRSVADDKTARVVVPGLVTDRPHI